MTISTQFTLSTTARQIVPPAPMERTVVVYNHDSLNAVYVGDSTVTSVGVDGIPVYPGTPSRSDELELGPQADLWAVAASGAPVVTVLVT